MPVLCCAVLLEIPVLERKKKLFHHFSVLQIMALLADALVEIQEQVLASDNEVVNLSLLVW